MGAEKKEPVVSLKNGPDEKNGDGDEHSVASRGCAGGPRGRRCVLRLGSAVIIVIAALIVGAPLAFWYGVRQNNREVELIERMLGRR